MVCVFQVVGPSGSGKTSVIEEALRRLKSKGIRVVVIKHSHHQLDLEGKDTSRFINSGADVVIFKGRGKTAIFLDVDPTLLALAIPSDVVLIEGWREANLGEVIEVEGREDWEKAISKIADEAEKCVSYEYVEVDGERKKATGLLELIDKLMKIGNIKAIKRV